MYLGGALIMTPSFCQIRAFLNTRTALEVRDLTLSAFQELFHVFRITSGKEVPVC